MAQGVFKRVGNTAVPVGKQAREALSAIPDGKTFMADFRTARNCEQSELFWTLCELFAMATDTTKDACKEWLLMKTNYVDMFMLPDGRMEIKTKSLKFESMEQTEFSRFFAAAIPLISEQLGSSRQEVRDQFEALLDPEIRAASLKTLRRILSPSLAPEQQTINDCQGERSDEAALDHVGRGSE